MPRYKLDIEFDGSRFVGWQAQLNGASVQSTLETAIFKFCGEKVRLQAAGRTDAGVHALGMVAHVDLLKAQKVERIEGALNFYLIDQGVVVLSATEMVGDFHARFTCIRRHYTYRIISRRTPLALDHGKAWHVRRELDVAAMHEAAQRLVGHYDFTTFRDLQCQATSPWKTLEYLDVEQRGAEIFIHTGSRSFLHRQVRSMVGTLSLVGEGKWTADDVSRALEAKDRRACGPTAPAHGLYFVAADYAEGGEMDCRVKPGNDKSVE
ncbi:tRNA pseudouridine(38-40) synthase TruA [Govanella unica]|uniref:tRNA pseudouridine synthase A n=1 Tax=Govanella unica TaxID=2975056 RepID=A0A9X3TVX2_9PROT|nr:tRNA pseudouridine(38-40) synthase TruA [Govania unica]MDA5192951.1 tRNA pseudouridine(38-40) synthase TruA [Govania unica]